MTKQPNLSILVKSQVIFHQGCQQRLLCWLFFRTGSLDFQPVILVFSFIDYLELEFYDACLENGRHIPS